MYWKLTKLRYKYTKLADTPALVRSVLWYFRWNVLFCRIWNMTHLPEHWIISNHFVSLANFMQLQFFLKFHFFSKAKYLLSHWPLNLMHFIVSHFVQNLIYFNQPTFQYLPSWTFYEYIINELINLLAIISWQVNQDKNLMAISLRHCSYRISLCSMMRHFYEV